ncbi:transient receptor potential cation channel subfamily A member 1 homolog isoform X2 [Haliotis rufescens]|uniref:transient receptor potential cation channel subfamily A member 1 homolog isoform X2 n=1 Tax=Haliotis rufescens TaxID=6454 RepID=UPI00201EBE40|nr:transient receptor potential cation channel subfamily A member 1 homolog isoform X2 [Haliotis rufescens]
MSTDMSSSDETDGELEDHQTHPTRSQGPDIHKLARQGDVVSLKDALDERRDGRTRKVDEKDDKGLTPLQHAVMYDSPEVVNYLINTRPAEGLEAANHLVQDKYGLSLAHYAAKSVRGITRNAPGTVNTWGNDDEQYSASVSSDERRSQTCLELLVQKDAKEIKLIYMKEEEHGQTPLHFAVMSGSIDSVKTLINKDRNSHKKQLIHTKDDQGLTPMHVAATYRQLDIMKYLMDRGAEFAEQDKDGSTPLHYACSAGTGAGVEMVDLLLQRANSKEMMEKKDTGGNTCLHIATENGHEEIVQKLLDNGANVSVARNDGMYPVHLAVISGNLKIVKSFVTKTESHNLEKNTKSTTLHLAAQYNQLEIAQYLLKELHGLVAMKDDNDNTPLHIAALFNQSQIVKLLMEYGGEIDAKNLKGRIPLHGAAKMGHIESLDILLDPRLLRHGKEFMRLKKRNRDIIAQRLKCAAKQDSNYEDSQARGAIEDIRGTLEHEAKTVHDRIPSHRIYRIVQALKAANRFKTVDKPTNSSRTSKVEPADIQTKNDVQRTAPKKQDDKKTQTKNDVQRTAPKKQDDGKTQVPADLDKDSVLDVDVFLKLVYTDNIINTEDNFGNTALHLAAQNGHTDFVQKMLLKHKVEHGRKNDTEKTALHLAAEKGHSKTVEVIVKVDKRGVFAEDQWRNSPLHLAVKGGHIETAEILIKNGADINQMNLDKMTPLDLAAQHGEVEICDLLVKLESQSWLGKHEDICPLHLACIKGHLKVVKLLLQKPADVMQKNNDKDKGLNCLDLAVKYGHKDVARYIVRHKYWEDALRNHVSIKKKNNKMSRKIVTPMRRMIRDMPDLAYEVLERCTETVVNSETGKEEKKYNFEFVDDLYENWAIPDRKKKKHTEVDLEKRKVPYTHRASVIKNNHPLSIMVECNRDELLQHPLVNKLIKRKWWHFGAYYYLANFGVHLFFVILLTRYMLQSTHPRGYTKAVSTSINDNTCSKEVSYGLVVEKILLYVVMGVGAFFEIVQMLNMRTAYLSNLESYVEWVAYIFTFLLLLEFSECTVTTGYRQDWQWSLGAFALFFSWIDLVLYLKAFTSLGLYVVMFQLVCWTFLKVFLVFFSLLLAFALGFHTLLQNQVPFRDVANSILKTAVMFVGEMDYNDIFNAGLNDTTATDTTNLLYPPATSVLFSIFITLASIVLMNLLVGLAVDDIKGTLLRAAFKQTAMHIELVLDVEKVLWNSLRELLYRKRNAQKKKKMPWLWKKFMGCSIWWWNQRIEKEENTVLVSIDDVAQQQRRLERLIVTLNRDVLTLLKHCDHEKPG